MNQPVNLLSGALAGLRVIDLTQNLGGPFCSMILADHGADVIKVEPIGGEELRRVPPFIEGQSAPYMMWNRNKRSITLDLKHRRRQGDAARAACRCRRVSGERAPRCDVAAWARLGQLEGRFPRLIVGSLSGFGQTGPKASDGGLDIVAQGMSGLMGINGPKDGPPQRLPIPICDLTSGSYLAIGILAAVEARHRIGRGQYVETSLLETATALQVYEAVHYFTHGTPPPRMGQAHRGASPYQVFPTSDGYVTVGAHSRTSSSRSAVSRASLELITDTRFGTGSDRVIHNDTLVALLSEATSKRHTDWWVETLTSLGVPCGPV